MDQSEFHAFLMLLEHEHIWNILLDFVEILNVRLVG